MISSCFLICGKFAILGTMDLKHRKLIKEKTELLVRYIDFNAIKPFVKREKIFTSEMFQDIDSEVDDSYRKKKFLDELQTRGPNAFSKFILVLKSAHQDEALKCIEGTVNTSRNTNNTHEESNSHSKFENYVNENNVPCAIKRGDVNHTYQMNSMPRGLCIIINNVDFKGVQDFRYGSDVDVKCLDKVFRKLGYKVEIETNLTALKMKNTLKNFSQSSEFKSVDSCIVILLSHGSDGYIDGTDSDRVSLSDILLLFDNENCENLVGKPKLFFIQACRGDDFNGITISLISDASEETTEENSLLNANEISKEEPLDNITDTLISFSTVKGYTSARDQILGTWYCQSLGECLQKYSLTKELSAILRRVDAEVQRFTGPSGEKQATELTKVGFSKDFYFNIPEENKEYFY